MSVFRPDRAAGRRPIRATASSTPASPPADAGDQPRGDRPTRPLPIDLLVIGLGYVGLPLAREAAFSGLTVAGYDLNAEMVAALNAGRSHVGDVPASDVAEMLGKGFRATSREEEAGDPNTVVICVPTPLSADGGPRPVGGPRSGRDDRAECSGRACSSSWSQPLIPARPMSWCGRCWRRLPG